MDVVRTTVQLFRRSLFLVFKTSQSLFIDFKHQRLLVVLRFLIQQQHYHYSMDLSLSCYCLRSCWWCQSWCNKGFIWVQLLHFSPHNLPQNTHNSLPDQALHIVLPLVLASQATCCLSLHKVPYQQGRISSFNRVAYPCCLGYHYFSGTNSTR